MKKAKVIVPILCIVGLMLLIFYFSSQNGFESHRLSQGIVQYIKDLSPVVKDLKESGWVRDINFDFLIRKFVHFWAYFALSLLIFAVAAGLRASAKRARSIALIICFLYSLSDEFHQFFISGRTSTIMDVFIDNFGSITAMVLLFYILKRRRMAPKPG